MRFRSGIGAIGACMLLLTHPASAQTKSKIIPADWLPALAPAIKTALADLKEANSQMEMNLLSREVADMTDAQLFIAYVRLYERLPQKERDALFAEQTKWLKERAKAAAAGVESDGGSLAPLEANNAELTFTERRLAELRARLKDLGGESTTPLKAAPVDEETPTKKKRGDADESKRSSSAKKKKAQKTSDED